MFFHQRFSGPILYTFVLITSFIIACNNRSGPVYPRDNPFDEGGANRFSAKIYEPTGETTASGAIVSVYKRGSDSISPVLSDTTDINGRFSIYGLPDGCFTLIARKDTCILFQDSLIITSSHTTLADDTLEYPKSLHGILSSVFFVNCNEVRIQLPGTGKVPVTIDSTGHFILTGLAYGTWPLRIGCARSKTSQKEFSFTILSNKKDIHLPDTIRPGTTRIHPEIGNNHVYYGSLHNHSFLSDGTGTPEEAYRYARYQAGLDFFSLADHCYSLDDSGWTRMKSAADSRNSDNEFVALWGFEWTSNIYGHITVTGTDNFTTVNNDATTSFTELSDWLIDNNGIAFINHPSVSFPGLKEVFRHPPIPNIVGMELWNKQTGFSYYYYNDGFTSDDNTKGYYDEMLSYGWHIGASGADDNHCGTWGSRSDYRLAILAPHLTRGNILTALRNRRFFSTADRNIVLSFSAEGHEMGSEITGNEHVFKIEAFDEDFEFFSKVIIYNGNHDILLERSPATTYVNISLPVTIDKSDYFYVKITEADGDEAISSPIWITVRE